MHRGGSKVSAVLQLNKDLRLARSLRDLGRIVEARLSEFDSRHVATSIYALAALGRLKPYNQLAIRVSDQLAPRLAEELKHDALGHRSLSNVCWAVAKLSGATPSLESHSISLAVSGALRSSQMNSQELSNTCWALASLQLTIATEGAEFWRAACDACPSVIASPELLPQHVTTLVWAMAVARVEDTFEVAGKATDAIAMQAGARYYEFSPQNVAMTMWAFAKLLQAPEPLLSLFHHHACNDGVEGFGPMQISTSAWALARISEVSDNATQNLFRILLIQRGCKRLSEFSEQGIANLCFALSNSMNPPQSPRLSTSVL